jgi:steroid delta-isomerase-like uncharacterized protein
MAQQQEDNKTLARRWFEEVWNRRLRVSIDELMSPDCVVHGLAEAQGPVKGREGFVPFFERFVAALPDIRITVDDVVAEGDTTVVRIRAQATHTGEGLGIAATHRPVNLTGIVWARWQDGQIVEAWNEFDALGMMQQLTTPPPVRIKP